jgi:RES domain-containing protein
LNLERLAVSRVSQRRTVRLIANANHKPPVLEKLASSYGARAHLEALESVTNARQIVQQKGIPGLAPEALASGYGFTYINAALAYTRPGGNRFNPPAWGVWYCAFDCETSLQEAAFHMTQALQAAGGDFDNETRYIELLADFEADFVDLRNQNPRPDCLHPDISIGYPAGQELADEIRASGHNGLVYPSVRHANGVCLAAFWPGLIQNFQQGESWILKWAGSPTPTIMRAANAA